MQLRRAVGGCVESVPFWGLFNGLHAWVICDEHGKLEGKPMNLKATMMWWDECPRMRDVDVLCGDILVVACDTAEEFRRL